MKSLVTGCAGFIGSHLTERLLKTQEVIGIDCFTDYYPREIKESNMKCFIDNPRFEFVEENILSADLKRILEDVDFVFHLAAQAGVQASWGEDFRIYTNNNVLATQKILEACKNSEIKRFIYASSSSVYGNAETIPVKESDVTKPISPYGVSKLAAEHLCNLYHANYGVPTVILRYFTVYGPRQRPDMAFNRFFHAIENHENITIYGDGKQTRDFTYISDIVEGTIRTGSSNVNGEVFNLAGGSSSSVLDAILIIEESTGKQAKINYRDPQKGDARNTYGDISKAKTVLGYLPKVGLRTGLRHYFEWLKSV